MERCGGKRKHERVVEDDEDDLLKILDQHYLDELNQDHALSDTFCPTDARNVAQLVMPLWETHNEVHAEVIQDAPEPRSEAQQESASDSNDDVLKFLDTERKRELNRQKQSRFRARKSMEVHESNDDELKRLDAEREQKTSRRRQSQCRARKRTRIIEAAGNASDESERPKESRAIPTKISFDNELSEDEREECLKRLQAALGAEGLDECTCAVCDRSTLRNDSRRVNDTDWSYMDKMKATLSVMKESLPDGLVEQYRAPAYMEDLKDVMISPRGIKCYVDQNGAPRAWFTVCKECNLAVESGKLPKFAVANGFYVGSLPQHLNGLTIPERFMTQLVTIVAMTRVMRGGRHRCIRSHCIAFDCTPGPPVSLLPRSISDVESYRVVMVGDFTPSQVTHVRKMHRIRAQRVRDVFEFYKAHNHLYTRILSNEDVMRNENLNDDAQQIFVEHVEDSGDVFNDGMSREQENIRGESETWRVDSERDESTVIERRMGLCDDMTPVMAREHSATAKVDERQFEIKRSDQMANDVTGDLFARMFPHLFPFGRGHPGEHRRVNVSVKECVKYYTMLSDRQFAEDELFALVAFDRISLRNMYIQNHFRCQRFPHLLDGYDGISADQLGRALLENERRRQGCLPWQPAADSVAQRFLKSVEIGTGSIWGSNAERSKCRHQAFAYQTRFGQPALFVTLTPNTDNSLVLAQYAGVSSVDSLFDLLEARLPSKVELREASLGNDCASARLFTRQVDAFIKYALGIDPICKKQLSFRGLFGDVKAYFGMVETQGRGTLHIHFLIWLNHCPPNSAAVERLLRSADGNTFRDRVASYAQHIVRNDIPIPVDACGCSNCGAPFTELVGLPIPDSARKDPQAWIRSRSVRSSVAEPPLIQCSICNMQFSSQHILRNGLLKFRPDHWPVWQHALSDSELKQQVATETICRDSDDQAASIVHEREINHASFSGDLVSGELFATEILEQANSARMAVCKSDNDPFRNDELTRRIEVSPPSSSDARMSRALRDYMVSALAVLLNQHLWSHTKSCFKQSKGTANDTFCRYRFPRDLVASTSFGLSGVELCRTLGHEFMNGFNYELMATFKCNHDVQILLGGSDVADRIHYCCKYVTKQQKRLDSQVAVAVAALKRREEREQIEALTVGEPDRLTSARKRVAGMVYCMTNRQEVAGPLAALYLYRGSCCYSSAKCMSLPLGDVIRQLTTSGEYSCRLVNINEEEDESNFRAVSFLDDYVFRPSALEKVNLYEFTMWYFRKKHENAVRSRYAFIDGHPLRDTHSLGKRYEDVVPVIQGFRMPFMSSDSSANTTGKYAVLSVVLFKPFRAVQDLIGESDSSDESSWMCAFNTWKSTRSPFVEVIMNNMNDYYSGLQKAEADSKAARAAHATHDHGSDGSSSDDNDDLFEAEDNIDFGDDLTRTNENEQFVSMWEVENDEAIVLDSLSIDPAACPTSIAPDNKVLHVINIFEKHGILDRVATDLTSDTRTTWPTDGLPAVALMKQWVRDVRTDNALVSSIAPIIPMGHDTQVVELLSDALLPRNREWQPLSKPTGDSTPSLAKRYASISETSTHFTLNEKQHYAFQLMGTALLSRWKRMETSEAVDSDLASELHANQLLMFLGGEGGTGKSRIIDAVHALCTSWGRPDCLMKTALTGKAATLISGRTLASFLLQIRKATSADSVIHLDLIVIDEVSMMKKYQLSQLDKRLRVAKRCASVPFGGIHVVLVGDFLQLPPVGGKPLFVDPTKVKRDRNKQKVKLSADELAGYELWQTFTDVIMLSESVRFRKDPEWGRGCQQARRGIWTPEFVRIINSRVLTDKEALSDGRFKTFVTPDNATRVSINNLFISTAAKLLPQGEYPVRVVANFKGKLSKLNRSEVRMVMSLPDTKFCRMAPYLDLIIGMPVQVTQNIRAEKMVANGTLGLLEAIVYHPDTSFRLVYDGVAGITVKIPSIPPPAVIVRIDRGDTATSMQGCVDTDMFPLFFDAQGYNGCEIPLAGSVKGVPRTLSVRIQQFPLVCAVSSTVYKVQGETLDGIVVTEWRSKSALANKREQPYLLVSRATSRDAFATLAPLTNDIVNWAHPSEAALYEEARLEKLSCETIARLQSTIMDQRRWSSR